ncbi:hypothetical protein DXG01_003288 [Tephrocybe rancida]|nr:hypothetical protein DXG01_003288 [Tephrocybe rancida]
MDSLENTLEENTPSTMRVIEEALREYFVTVTSCSQNITAWMATMRSTVLYHGSDDVTWQLIGWYTRLPIPIIDSDQMLVSYHGITNITSLERWDLCALQSMAFLRGVGVFPILSDPPVMKLSTSTLKKWFPFRLFEVQEPPNADTFMRELQPVALALEMLSQSKSAQAQVHGLGPWELPPSHDVPLLLPIRRPFTMSASFLHDASYGSSKRSSIELFKLVAALKRYNPKKIDHFTISNTLGVLYPSSGRAVSQDAALLFIGALQAILTWEREADENHPCPFSDKNINLLVTCLKETLLSLSEGEDFEIETAEATFCTGATLALLSQQRSTQMVTDWDEPSPPESELDLRRLSSSDDVNSTSGEWSWNHEAFERRRLRVEIICQEIMVQRPFMRERELS